MSSPALNLVRIQNRSSNPIHAHFPIGPKSKETLEKYQEKNPDSGVTGFTDYDFSAGRALAVPEELAAHLLKWPNHFVTDEEANRQAAATQESIAQKDETILSLQDRLAKVEELMACAMAGGEDAATAAQNLATLLNLKTEKKAVPADGDPNQTAPTA